MYHSKNIQIYIMTFVKAGYLEMTNLEYPNASNQKYRRKMNSHIFINKNGNTLMRKFEGVLSNKPSIGLLKLSVSNIIYSDEFSTFEKKPAKCHKNTE